MKKAFCFLVVTLFFLGWRLGSPLSLNKGNQTAYVYSAMSAAEPEKSKYQPLEPLLSCRFYDVDEFRRSVMGLKAEADKGIKEGKHAAVYLGGIVPHHLLAGEMIANFFHKISVQKPEIIILLGPNHNRVGQKKIHSGGWSWQTPFSVLKSDRDMVASIKKIVPVEEDFKLLETDHAISALVPYVGYFTPETRLVPLLLHANLSMEECQQLAEVLWDSIKDKNALVISSIDFSHYLPAKKAYEMDQVTLEAISKWDKEKILKMGNGNLDAPSVLVTFLLIMQRLGADNQILMEHTNSADILKQSLDSTTSYMTILFSD